jgi:hypothetical protein
VRLQRIGSSTSFFMKGKCILPLWLLDLPIYGMLNLWGHAIIFGLTQNRKTKSFMDS